MGTVAVMIITTRYRCLVAVRSLGRMPCVWLRVPCVHRSLHCVSGYVCLACIGLYTVCLASCALRASVFTRVACVLCLVCPRSLCGVSCAVCPACSGHGRGCWPMLTEEYACFTRVTCSLLAAHAHLMLWLGCLHGNTPPNQV